MHEFSSRQTRESKVPYMTLVGYLVRSPVTRKLRHSSLSSLSGLMLFTVFLDGEVKGVFMSNQYHSIMTVLIFTCFIMFMIL